MNIEQTMVKLKMVFIVNLYLKLTKINIKAKLKKLNRWLFDNTRDSNTI